MLRNSKISFILVSISGLLLVGVYVYSLWASDRKRNGERPAEATDVMLRDLRSFHKKRGGFPANLKDLEGIVWERKESRTYSNDERGLTHGNYHYLYTRVTHHQFTLWAIPMGRQRDEAATWFLTVSPDSQRRWKGPALNTDDIKALSLQPFANQLTVLGLIEQPVVRSPRH